MLQIAFKTQCLQHNINSKDAHIKFKTNTKPTQQTIIQAEKLHKQNLWGKQPV